MAHSLVPGKMHTAIAAFRALPKCLPSADVPAILVNWARRRQLQYEFALPLLFEAGL